MKYKLNKPDINSADVTKVNNLADYMGWTFKFDLQRKSALVETIDKEVGYIQKDEDSERLFIVWKHNEEIEYIDELINISIQYRNLLSNMNNKRNMFNFFIDLLCPKKSKMLIT
jgi:hypothetical protein